jgi:hypothetical protein
MTDNPIAAFRGAGLPSREEVGQFLNNAAMAIPAGSGGKQFLKISDRDGAWTFGADETVIEEDSLWAVNPLSFFHGYIAWNDGKPEGEHRQSVNRPVLPSLDALPPVKAEKGWQKQVGFDLVCLTGEDAGVLCEYKASSVGGTRGAGTLAAAIGTQYGKDPDRIVPVIKLRDNKYYDKKYKKDQFPPVFEIVEWRAMDDAAPVEPEKAKEAAPAAAPPRSRMPTASPEALAAGAAASSPNAEEDAAIAAEYEAAQAAAANPVPRRRVRR